MVNFRDPAVIQQDEWAVVKLWHALAGLYFWEFLNTLDYEWSIIKGHRPYRWSIWIYSLTRVAALISVILSLIGVDDSTQYNCQIQNKFQFIFGYLTFATASLLILLRIIAIWNEKKIVIAIATTVWAVNLSFFIRGIVRIHSVWVPAGTTCEVTNIQSTKPNIILALATDLVLVGIMLVGLLRLGYHERGAFGIGHLLWKQGLIWLLIATVAEVPPAVFIILNLNEPFNEMFQIPAMIALSIAATRIHRSLTDFAARSTEISTGPTLPETRGQTVNRTPDASIPRNQKDAGVIHIAREQHRTPPLSQGRLWNKPSSMRYNDDVENGADVWRGVP